MRRWWLVPLILSLALPCSQATIPTVKKIVIIALSKDTALSAQVESGLKDNFSEKGVSASSLRVLFTNTVPVPAMIKQLRASGYDSLLCLAPRKTIQISNPSLASAETDIHHCLTTYVTGAYPSGEPLDVSPLSQDQPMTGTAAPESLRGPIPTNPSAAPFQVNKGTVRLYDLSTGKLVWQQSVQVKIPGELQTDLLAKLIVHDVWEILSKSGILPNPQTP